MTRRFLSVPVLGGLLLILLFFLPTDAVRAQGFSVYEQGTCAMGRAETAVARPCGDGSTLFYNPAGLADAREGLTIGGGVTSIAAFGGFTDDRTGTETDLENAPEYVPHLFATYGVSDRLGVGLGVFVPYGLSTEWPRSFEGAFEGYNNSVQTFFIQPTVAYQVNDRLRIGGGLDVALGIVELNQVVDLSQQNLPGAPLRFGQIGIPFHTAFADANIASDGPAFGIGGNIGMLFEATDRLDVGVRYMLPVTLKYEGTASFTQVDTDLVLPPGNPIGLLTGVQGSIAVDDLVAGQFADGGTLVGQGVETELEMPAQFVVGLSYDATDRLALLFDYQWTGWSAFDVVELDFENDALDSEREENYNNTSAFRFGAAYDVTDALTVRAGGLHNRTAAPDETVTPLLPEANRYHGTAGLGYSPTDAVTVDVAYQYLGQVDRRGRVREALPDENNPTAEELNSGLYSFGAHLFAATVTVRL